jgi:hypothetical protein
VLTDSFYRILINTQDAHEYNVFTVGIGMKLFLYKINFLLFPDVQFIFFLPIERGDTLRSPIPENGGNM